MKCAFLCLLALCAFQTVFADEIPWSDLKKFYHANSESVDKLYEVITGLEDDLKKASDAAKIKEILFGKIKDTCDPDGYKKCYDIYSNGMDQCNQCFDKVPESDRIKEIKGAKKCCNKILAALQKQVNSSRDKIMECIKKCAPNEDDCKKMIKHKFVDCKKKPGDKNCKSDEIDPQQ